MSCCTSSFITWERTVASLTSLVSLVLLVLIVLRLLAVSCA